MGKKIPAWQVAMCLTVGIALLAYSIFFGYGEAHMPLLLAAAFTVIVAMLNGWKWAYLEKGMIESVNRTMGACLILLMVGVLVATWKAGGIIPTMIYYGLKILNPHYFLITAAVLCSIVSLVIGSSYTTAGTIGVALIGISLGLGINPAMAAGAVVSGAYFGDKMSPLSDTTGISASIVGIDLFEHIKNMMYTTVPAWLISAALMLWLLPNVAAHDMNSVEAFRAQLEATGLVHAYSLIPFALLVILALMRVNAIVAMLFTVMVALIVTYFHSTPDLKQLGAWFYSGYKLEGEAFKDIARLISRGGLESMFFTQTIVILGMSLGGLLFSIGVIPSLLEAIRAFLTNAGRATFSVAMTSVGVNFLIGEQYLSILLSGETFKPVYDKLGLHSRNLARTLEDAGTVINPLVPWSVCGVFISHALGVPVWEYLPYAFFCYLSLALTLVFGWTGLTLSKK